MSTLSTHVLDTARGRPAAGVPVALERERAPGDFEMLGSGATDADGRLKTLLPEGRPLEAGTYRLTFDTGAYFAAAGIDAFYPVAHITFRVTAAEHHHVPLLLAPFGYSTYRGS
jgi:5-hydroxyisourate hydrolase